MPKEKKKNKKILKYKTSKKKTTTSRSKNTHLSILPLKYFPRKRGNKAKQYRDDLVRMIQVLAYNDKKVQYSTQICIYNIKSINQKNLPTPLPDDVFLVLEEFVYHYENFCYRVFSYREKLLKFLNEILYVGLPEKDVNIRLFLMHSKIKDAGMIATLEKFSKNKILRELIKDRNALTHKLYYGKEFDELLRPIQTKPVANKSDFQKWCNKWKKEVQKRSDFCREGIQILFNIDSEVADKIIKFRDSNKRK